MRRLTIGLLSIGLAGAACDRSAGVATATRSTDAVATAAPAPVHELTVREVTIPAGTELPIVLDTPVGSDISHSEEPIEAHVSRAVSIDGEPILAEGAIVRGVVTEARRSGRVKGRAHVALRFDTLAPRGSDERYKIQTSAVARTATATKEKDALEIGGPALGGAIIGAIAGGKKGAAIGTAVGGGAGTAVVLSTRGKETHLPKGAVLTLRLTEPVAIRVRS